MKALSIRDLTFDYAQQGSESQSRSPLYKGLSLDVQAGEITAVMGPSGSGKSTLGKIVGDIIAPTSGKLLWEPPYVKGRHRVYMNQAPEKSIWNHQTVWDNIDWPLRQIGLPDAQRAGKIRAILEEVKLGAFARRFPRDLSGGQVSRLALARQLAAEPLSIVMDECLNGLDLSTKEVILTVLSKRIQVPNNVTLFITHHINEVLKLADRCLILGNQRPVEIIADIRIHLPRPRDEASPEYAELQSELLKHLANDF